MNLITTYILTHALQFWRVLLFLWRRTPTEDKKNRSWTNAAQPLTLGPYDRSVRPHEAASDSRGQFPFPLQQCRLILLTQSQLSGHYLPRRVEATSFRSCD